MRRRRKQLVTTPEHTVSRSPGTTQKRIIITFAVVEALLLGAFVLRELLG